MGVRPANPTDFLCIERIKLHGLLDIMVLSVCVIISGAEGWQGIVDFGHEKPDWLRRLVPLKNGVPSP
ncbi:MAG: transposase family protein [Methylococcales bacterium]|nr:transposase family protein [Methylococcales bacterium]